MAKPKVSIVLNFYNEEKYLKIAIESMINQTYDDYELILVDDASTDRSFDIAMSYQGDRVKVVRTETNKGAAHARNTGMRISEGEYIAFIDGDDFSKLDRIEKQVKYLDEYKDVLAVSCLANYIDEDGFIIGKETIELLSKSEVKASFLFGNQFSQSGAMIRSSVFRKYNIYQKEDLRVSQDYFFWLQILQKGDVYILPERLVYYRIHNSKASQRANNNRKEYNRLMSKLINYAWESKGLYVTNEEVEFIYIHFFKAKVIWRIKHFIYFIRIWGKICDKKTRIKEEDRNAIKKIFIKYIKKRTAYIIIFNKIKYKISDLL